EKPEIVALSQIDILTPEERKKKVAALKRAAGRAPMLVSAATGEGVQDVLRALMRQIEGRDEEW
ncbi:GTPase ObgE, partial [Escherichia coli]|nr:GTPase ObgE [Escherichia coli]